MLAVLVLFSLSLFSQNMSVKRNIHTKEKQEKTDNEDSSATESGLQCVSNDILDVGYQLGMGKYKKNRFSLNALPIYQVKPYLRLGYGGALRYYHDEEAILVPLLTEFRISYYRYKYNLPYLGARFGYSFELTDSEYFKDTGLLVDLTLGYSFNISNNTLLNMEVGYAFQEAIIYYDDSYLNKDVGLHAISFSVGILR